MAYTSPETLNLSQSMNPLFYWISEVTNFWFGRMILVAIFVLFLAGYMRKEEGDFVGGVAIASYICFILGLIFWVIGLVTGVDFAMVLGVTLISSIVLLMQKKDY